MQQYSNSYQGISTPYMSSPRALPGSSLTHQPPAHGNQIKILHPMDWISDPIDSLSYQQLPAYQRPRPRPAPNKNGPSNPLNAHPFLRNPQSHTPKSIFHPQIEKRHQIRHPKTLFQAEQANFTAPTILA
ncbi:hypothetical protein WAI453_007052 [Rhynchosporium graminicola]